MGERRTVRLLGVGRRPVRLLGVGRRPVRLLGVDFEYSRAALLLTIGVLALVVPQAWHQITLRPTYRLVDLAVYRDAGVSILRGRSVYHHLTPPPQSLGFTYPPTAALLAVPLALVPLAPLGVLWTLGSYALLAAVVLVGARQALQKLGPLRAALLAPALWLVAAYLLPIRGVVRFGQVGLLLAGLVLADLLPARTRWPRGLLVGLATAMKLTPGVFIIYLWLTGRRRAALTALASFAGLVAFTFAVLPGTSREYWLPPHGALWVADRLGDNANTSNQSVRGMLLRAALPHEPATVLVLLAAVAVAVVGFWRARAVWRAGDDLAGIAIVGLLAVLLSPVAWIHHMVWVVLVIGVLLADLSSRRRILAAAGVALLFTLSLPWWGDHAVYRHVEKSRMTYALPGSATQLPLLGVHRADELPPGTTFQLHPTRRPVVDVPEAALRPNLDRCLRAPERRPCLATKRPGSTVGPWQLLQSAYGLLAIVLVAVLPARPRVTPEADQPSPART